MMFKSIFRTISLLGLISLSCGFSFAQVKTGLPTFGSFSGGPDAINLANLNLHLTLPIMSKPGRGLPLVYTIGYDGSIWSPQVINGNKVWTPAANWGFITGLPAWNGKVTYSSTSNCTYLPPPYNYELCTYTGSNVAYTDANGTVHPTNYSWEEVCDPSCSGGSSGTLLATDGSGYTISSSLTAVTDRSGTTITTGSGSLGTAGSIEDTNGNYLSASTSGSDINIKDTTGVIPLTITSSDTLTIPTGTVTLDYSTFPIWTDFGCSGVAEYGPKNVSLLASIGMPDGTAYTFTYEQTAGHAGYYTGRLASINLPSGETITYTYTGTSCSDGSATGLRRATPDGMWTYLRNGSETTVTAPKLAYDSTGNQTVYTFDSNGHETERQMYQGSAPGTALETISTTWDSTDTTPTKTVTTLAESGGSLQSEIDTSYDAYGNLTSKTEHGWGSSGPGSAFRTTTYTFNNAYGAIADLLTDETISDGSTVEYRKHVDYDGSQITNCPTGVTNHDDTNYSCTSATKRGNPTTVTTYTDPADSTGPVAKTFSYDVFGNEIGAQLNCCQQKTWVYSGLTQYVFPDSVTSGSSPSLTTSYAYNLSTGAVTSITDPNGLITSLQYNSTTGLLSSVNYPDGNSESISYTYQGSIDGYGLSYSWPTSKEVTTMLAPGESVSKTTTLDGMGRPVAVGTSGGGISYTTAFEYDSLGRQYGTSNPNSTYWTTTQFDALGRPTETILPDNEKTLYTYSISTQNSVPTVIVTDPAGKEREAQIDAAGRTADVYEPDPSNGNSLTVGTTYTYDALDDLTRVSQGSQTRAYTYNGLGQLITATTPEGGTTCYGTISNNSCQSGYDDFDNLLSRTDARGVVTSYTYDGLNRLSGISYSIPQGSGVSAMPNDCDPTSPTGSNDTANVCFYYDQGGASGYALGKLTEIEDPSGSQIDAYNNMGSITQVQKVISGATYTTSYQYNYAGEITQMTYPSGHQVSPTYDAIGRLAGVSGDISGSNVAYASEFMYDPAQQVTQFQYGNGVYASYGFSPDQLQLTCLDYSTTNRDGTCGHDSTTLFGLDYGYTQNAGNDGQITSVTDDVDNGRTATYSYDSLGRLIEAATAGSTAYPKWDLKWTYDRYGNRVTQSIKSGCVAPMTCPTNSVTVDAATNHISDAGYAYDPSGNMTNDGQNTLVYDGENRLTSSSSGNLGSASYVYDGNGLRVEKTSGGATTVYIYSGTKEIAEYQSGASPTSPTMEFVYAGSRLIANSYQGGAPTYFLSDNLSNRLLTNSSGSAIERLGDFPYGEEWYDSGTSSTKWKFTTYPRDAESGNDYATGREYVNRLGRFSALDAAAPSIYDPQSMNRYSYVEGDPINNIDPSGQDFMTQVIIAGSINFWEFGGLGYDEFSFLALAAQPPVAEVLNETDWYYDLSSGCCTTTLMYWDTTVNSVSYLYANSAALNFVGLSAGATGGTPAPAVGIQAKLTQIMATSPDCASLLGGQAGADGLISKMVLEDSAARGYRPNTPGASASLAMIAEGHPAATTFGYSGRGDAATWNGRAYWTYTGSMFDKMPLDQQETILIHEMGHVYTASNDKPSIPDRPDSEYTYQNIVAKCKTGMPIRPK
jgi:RHS repeat-associated protein